MEALRAGILLVSEPFLGDPNFHRTVILIVEHNENGTLGFVLNQKTALTVVDLFEDFDCLDPVHIGGPVGRDTFHYIHNLEHLQGAQEICKDVYWGGDFDMLQVLLSDEKPADVKVKFFAGYSGWSEGQLQSEIEAKSWIVVPGSNKSVFLDELEMWRTVLRDEGGDLGWMSNAPDDVSLN